MSGLDEQYKPLVSNNVFYQIFRSLRFDYLEGVEERMGWLLKVLPHTSIKDVKEMIGYLDRALHEWKQRGLSEDYGTRYFRDGPYCYMNPEGWMPDWKYVNLLDTDGKAFSSMTYEDAERVYDLWKSHCLTWREGE